MFKCCCRCSPLTAQEFENSTTVRPYLTGASAGIPPYARPWYDWSETNTCILASEPDETCGQPDLPVCYTHGFDGVALTLPAVITGIDECTGEGGDLVSQVLNNCFKSTGNTVSFPRYGPRCGRGWKAVAAHSVWSGRFGFLNQGLDPSNGICCPEYGTEQDKFTSIRMKYEASSAKVNTRTRDGGAGVTTVTENYVNSWDQIATVDAIGNVTRAGHLQSHYDSVNSDFPGAAIDQTDNCTGLTAVPVGGGFIEYPVTPAMIGAPEPVSIGCGGVITFNGQSGTASELTALNMFAIVDYPSDPYFEMVSSSGDSGTFTLTDSTLTITFSGAVYATNDHPPDVGDSFLELTHTYSFRLTLELSGSNAFSSVIADCKLLLDEWRLNDDRVHPWRTDEKLWLLPYVSRDAAATEPYIDWTVDESCEFSQLQLYTGDILGSPMPAGYGYSGGARSGFFNFRHINWERRDNGLGLCSSCEMSLGMASPDEVPATATQWTDNYYGSSLFGPGGHVSQRINHNYDASDSIGQTPLHGVTMQKWAETADPWPMFNHARGTAGCGHDRWLRDESTFACYHDDGSFDGENLVLNSDETQEFAEGDLLGLPEGVYEVMTKTDPLNYILGDGTTAGEIKYALPASVVYVDVAKLRYPSARAICGKLDLSSGTQAAENDPVTFVVARKHWLRAGDTVDFTSVTGLGSGVAVTVVDEHTFTVPFTGTYTFAGGYISQTGAQIDWDTTCSSHTYVTREWQSELREAEDDPENPGYALTLAQEEYTLPSSKPYVLCVSPNAGDTFEFGRTYDFGDIEADMCYGASGDAFAEEWHRDFIQYNTDPFWQAPHEPCDHTGDWGMASQPCGETADQYSFKPLVEPLLDPLAGAPTQPTALYISEEPGDHPMPGAIGMPPACSGNEPVSVMVPGSIREAWEGCADWQDAANANCGTGGF